MIKFSDILLEYPEKIKCNHCGRSWKKSEGGKDLHVCHKCGHDSSPNSLDTFADKRMGGATKIANETKEKGGLSMLTHHHYAVKLPYYKKASEGKFNVGDAKKEFNKCVKQLSDNMKQVAFQKLMGRIEVLGELIIKNK